MPLLEPITPEIEWTPQDVLRVIETTGNETLHAIEDDFKKTARTWRTKVDWILIQLYPSGNSLTGASGTNNKIYGYVSQGTKPHVIKPKRSKYLRFLSGYRAKTIAGRIGSNAGGAYGTDVYAQTVNHPGTKAREFEETVAAKYQKVIEKRMQEALNKAFKVE